MKSTSLALLCLALGIALGTGIGLVLTGSTPVEAADPVAPTRGARPAAAAERTTGSSASLPAVPSAPASPTTANLAPAAKTSAEAKAMAKRALVDVRGSAAAVEYTARVTGMVKGPDGAPMKDTQVVCRNNAPRRDYSRIRASTTDKVGRAWKGFSDVEESVASSAQKALDQRRRLRTTRTDAEGRFTLEGLREGEVTIEAFAEGFTIAAETCSSGDEVVLTAKAVNEVSFALTMDDGTVPDEAILHVEHRTGQSSSSRNLRWTPDAPAIRTSWDRFTVKAIAGEARRSNQEIIGDAMSEILTVNVGVDGLGPHALELVRAQVLVVDVDHPGRKDNDWGWSLKIVEGTVDDSFDWSPYEIASLDRNYRGPYQTSGLAAGTYTLGYLRQGSSRGVTRVIEVVQGRTEIDFEIPPPSPDDHLVVLCLGPAGNPVEDVTVRTRHIYKEGSNGGQQGFQNGEPGETWIPWSSILRDRTWSAGDSVEVTADSQTLGVYTETIEEKAGRLTITYASPSRLDVTLRGGDPADYQVSAKVAAEGDQRMYQTHYYVGSSGSPMGPKRFGDDGVATFTQLQPGTYELTVTKAPLTSENRWHHGEKVLVSDTVTLSGESSACTLTLPTLHEVIVSAPKVNAGTTFMLSPKTGNDPFFRGHEAKTDEGGQAVFTEIPAGEYTLRSRSNWQESMTITVPCGTVVYDPKSPNSLIVSGVVKNGIGAKAGFQNGDVIVGVDGTRATSVPALSMLFIKAAEETVDVTVRRGRNEIVLQLGPLGDVTSGRVNPGMNMQPHVLE